MSASQNAYFCIQERKDFLHHHDFVKSLPQSKLLAVKSGNQQCSFDSAKQKLSSCSIQEKSPRRLEENAPQGPNKVQTKNEKTIEVWNKMNGEGAGVIFTIVLIISSCLKIICFNFSSSAVTNRLELQVGNISTRKQVHPINCRVTQELLKDIFSHYFLLY